MIYQGYGMSLLGKSRLAVSIDDLLATYSMYHQFTNHEDEAIEAVFSFPVPLDAAFISMEATLAGETLRANIMPACSAERDYDDAIGEGDSAVLLEQLEPGLLCVNLGNLKPRESGEIHLRFSAQLNTADGMARFSLPLVQRPRYGDSCLPEWAQPEVDFTIEHPLDAEIQVSGLLEHCPVQCNIEGVLFARKPECIMLNIQHAMLDRDLVLNFHLGKEPLGIAHMVADGEGSIGIVSYSVPQSEKLPTTPRDFCVLLDCSASMQGDAMVQQREALVALSEQLLDTDSIQVIRFGSDSQNLFRRPMKAVKRVREALVELAGNMTASMGGTEMGEVLEKAADSFHGSAAAVEQKIIVLVTDGAVQPNALVQVQARLKDLGVRVFVVAVGSSAGVDVLQPLADASHAHVERATSAEPIADAVMRQIRRARQLPVAIESSWQGDGAQALPLPPVYPGDAITTLAFYPQPVEGKAGLAIRALDMDERFDTGPVIEHPGWRSWAGNQLYLQADQEAREAIALRYGLITDETKALLVKVRADDDKVDGLPIMRTVGSMLTKGMLSANLDYLDKPVFARRVMGVGDREQAYPDLDYLDIPAFLSKNPITHEPLDPEISAFLRQAVPGCTDDEAAFRHLGQHSCRLTRAAGEALHSVITELKTSKGLTSVSIDQLLQRLQPQYHATIKQWLASLGLDGEAIDLAKLGRVLHAYSEANALVIPGLSLAF